MWDRHWCRGAVERAAAMAPAFNAAIHAARSRGAVIVHAPSDTTGFYKDHPARLSILKIPKVSPPEPMPHEDPPLPIDDSDGGGDTGDPPLTKPYPWTRQMAALDIDSEKDFISESGIEIYSLFKSRGIQNMLMMGVHTNMCVLNRPFAIKAMVRWGFDVFLCRDLTDAMYNPAMRPYVSHEEGTALVIEYIEKFWCASILSRDLQSK